MIEPPDPPALWFDGAIGALRAAALLAAAALLGLALGALQSPPPDSPLIHEGSRS